MPPKLKIFLGRCRQLFSQIILKPCGFEIIKSGVFEPLTTAQFLDWSLQSLEVVKCIQVGAHDGIREDHLVLLRPRANWHNWLLEPQPEPFQSLQANTRDQPNTTCLPLALVPDAESRDLKFYHLNTEILGGRFPHYSVLSQLSSFRREKLENELSSILGETEIPSDWIQTTSVKTITWESLIAQTSVVSPDLVVLDTEGLDGQLIQSFPFDRFSPHVMMFENMWLNDHEFDQVRALLSQNNYQTITIGVDSIAIQRDLFERNTKLGRKDIAPL
jgi:FkbM family methyltransferase